MPDTSTPPREPVPFFPPWSGPPPTHIPPVIIPPVEPPCDEDKDEDCGENPPEEPPTDAPEPGTLILLMTGALLYRLYFGKLSPVKIKS